ncbi:DUF397 domain-containing protein [Actinoplanes sp. NPDC051861]|uniref:DUF397 domain-containing protein n=1 Tax=Actinoplanes sp. NPDC051861 TaxID=3155170 RepID=UPI003444F11A
MVESTLEWSRSSFCADGACVEVAPRGDGWVSLRDSKNPDQPPLEFSSLDWDGFLARVVAGEYRDL